MSNPPTQTPPGWYPEPSGAPGQRWWDGTQWTEHINQAAPTATEQRNPFEVPLQRAPDPARVQRQVQQQAGVGGPVTGGGGTLFTEPILVVNQKTKLIELSNEYSVFDQHGRQIGSVAQVGQSTAKKVVRFLSSLDQFMTHRLEVRDAHGRPQLHVTRPAKVFKSRFEVQRPDGAVIGEIVQQNVFGKINFGLLAGGHQLGAIQAQNWRAWNFSIVDHTGAEVAKITKTWEGVMKTMFTTADNYVVQMLRPLPDPLLSLVVASALTVDTALKQDKRGLG